MAQLPELVQDSNSLWNSAIASADSTILAGAGWVGGFAVAVGTADTVSTLRLRNSTGGTIQWQHQIAPAATVGGTETVIFDNKQAPYFSNAIRASVSNSAVVSVLYRARNR